MIHLIGALACATVIWASVGAKIKRLYKWLKRSKKDEITAVKALASLYRKQK
ncbi:hypothetical protein [Rummeliibacillus suwonensis]|uniref:hypothetical protein n=1 Tax=Rummeliibacillus suwonensis TaxID=1306154 RepID=UPI001AAE2384|nr:hypothetical protein [Rummeliibacillus suwonensis]MBO2536006.1 hypothetical protein [Rummeliibacillus suwonensis]